MSSISAGNALPPIKAHVLVTFERLKHYEECKKELSAIKRGRPDQEEEGGARKRVRFSEEEKWDNQPETLYPERHDFALENTRNFSPLLSASDDSEEEEGNAAKGMSGAGGGALDSVALRKLELTHQRAIDERENRQQGTSAPGWSDGDGDGAIDEPAPKGDITELAAKIVPAPAVRIKISPRKSVPTPKLVRPPKVKSPPAIGNIDDFWYIGDG